MAAHSLFSLAPVTLLVGLTRAALPAEAPSVLAALESSTEAECMVGLETANPAGLRGLSFTAVEQLIHKGWWKAAQALVIKSHSARVDFTAPVRRATNEMKREADSLLKWLDPRFANPEETPMALKWAQNGSSVMLVARFASKWDSPGASLAVYSTERGRGHVDKERTAEKIRDLLQVNISGSRVEAEIIADSGSARKRYTLELGLFDRVVPERSGWAVEFQRAQGSMQMSTGAQIPELVLTLRKRWPGPRRWPRLTAAPEEEGGLAPPWWAGAPGLTENGTDALRQRRERDATPLTCARRGGLFCSAKDACLPSCEQCKAAEVALIEEHRCFGLPRVTPVRNATFTDEDLSPALIGGPLRWKHSMGDPLDDFADSFVVQWGAGETEAEALAVASVAEIDIFADELLEVALPAGTAPPAGASHLHVFAVNRVGRALVLAAPVHDRVRSPPARGLQFEDEDAREGFIAGTVEVVRADDETYVESYEVRWGRAGVDGVVAPMDFTDARFSVLAELAKEAAGPGSAVSLRVEPAEIPLRATHLVAYAVGRGGVLSEPTSLWLSDSQPPTLEPRAIGAGIDDSPKSRIVSLELRVTPAVCGAHAPKSAKAAKVGRPRACDVGSAVVIYWVNQTKAIVGERIAELTPETLEHKLQDAPIPEGASAVMAVAKNRFGEMSTGPTAKIVDNQGEKVAAWEGSKVVAAGTDGSISFWKPFALGSKPAPLKTTGRSITAIAADELGFQVLLGHDDGSVAVVDVGEDKVVKTLMGSGRVASLAFSGRSAQLVRGAKGGALEWWDIGLGVAVAQLQGHTDTVMSVEAEWQLSRLASSSRDGSIKIWTLEGGRTDAEQPTPLLSPTLSIATSPASAQGSGCFASIWQHSRLMAPVDEALQLFDLQTGDRLWALEGHSEPVRFVTMDWDHMRALSVAQDNVVKVWDLQSRECILTLEKAGLEPIRTVRARWESMQAMAVLYDGSVALWDLRDPDAHFDTVPSGRAVRAALVLQTAFSS